MTRQYEVIICANPRCNKPFQADIRDVRKFCSDSCKYGNCESTSEGFNRLLADIDRIEQDVADGVYNYVLARRYGVSKPVISTFLRANGIKRQPTSVCEEHDLKIRKWCREGKSYRYIAKQLGYSSTSVMRYCKMKGIRALPRKKYNFSAIK